MLQLARGANGIRTIIFPGTVRDVECGAFTNNWSLQSAVLNEGLEALGNIFSGTGIERLALPRTLKNISRYALSGCGILRRVYVEDGCEADFFAAGTPDSVKVGPPPATTAGGARVWDLRNCREVVIPEGTERIGNYWFYGCGIEDITFPASVREIGAWAFCKCSGLTSVAFPAGLRTVGDGAFSGCAGLERAVLNEGLEKLGACENRWNP